MAIGKACEAMRKAVALDAGELPGELGLQRISQIDQERTSGHPAVGEQDVVGGILVLGVMRHRGTSPDPGSVAITCPYVGSDRRASMTARKSESSSSASPAQTKR